MLTVKGIEIGSGIPKICVPITGSTRQEVVEEGRKLKDKRIDLVEWRVDFFEEVEDVNEVLSVLEELKSIIDKPLIFTFRRKREGGQREISEMYYLYLNRMVAESKLVHIIDIELFTENVENIIDIVHQQNVYTIISNHDFIQTPSKMELCDRLIEVQKMGGDIAKIAVMPNSTTDVITLLDVTQEMSEKLDIPVVTMSMSTKGLISRLIGESTGSAITFGIVENASAPGQIPVEELYKVLEIIHKNMY